MEDAGKPLVEYSQAVHVERQTDVQVEFKTKTKWGSQKHALTCKDLSW